MKFWRRLRFYGIGLAIGTILTFIIFGNRGCSWLPENRVLKRVATSSMEITGDALCRAECMGLHPDDLYKALSSEEMEVYFSESDTKAENKHYILKGDHKGDELEIGVLLIDTLARVDEVALSGFSGDCDCSDAREGNFILWKPEDVLRKELLGLTPGVTSTARCQLESIGLTKEALADVLRKGSLDYELSDLYGNANPHWAMHPEDDESISFILEQGDKTVLLREVRCDDCRPCPE